MGRPLLHDLLPSSSVTQASLRFAHTYGGVNHGRNNIRNDYFTSFDSRDQQEVI
nr:MAG TPA: hypothetical protein [Caudoviricetes sp.]